jgi:signal transduction histidine kinase
MAAATRRQYPPRPPSDADSGIPEVDFALAAATIGWGWHLRQPLTMKQGDPPLNLLVHAAYPDLGAAVRKRSATVIQRWEEAVRDALPKADELTFSQLRDDLPRVLTQIAEALQADGARPVEDLLAVSSAHGTTRFHQSYDLNQVLMEYDLLRLVLIEEVIHELGRRLSVEEITALNFGVDLASRRSVVTFVQHQAQGLSAAMESQSKYLSLLSHDLRGGLNGVFLMIEVLKRQLAGESQFKSTIDDLDVMRRSLLETVGTMDRFLHAERFRKGKVPVRPARLELQRIASELVAHFIYQAQDKGLALECDVAKECMVASDRELMTLVLQNLVSNALKYTDRGTVRLTGKPTADGGALVAVIDQGPGIDAAKMSELFAPFTRGQTYGKPGVGLGLSIARQAADLLQAKLWAESSPGKGSTFFLELPREIPEKPQG